MTSNLRELADKALELSGKATKGPWQALIQRYNAGVESCGPLLRCLDFRDTDAADDQARQDAAFIAFARDALPKLAEEYLRPTSIAAQNYRHVTDLEIKIATAREALQEMYITLITVEDADIALEEILPAMRGALEAIK
jgi:hypothetical protein